MQDAPPRPRRQLGALLSLAADDSGKGTNAMKTRLLFLLPLFSLCAASPCAAEPITPSPYWKNRIVFPDDPFRASRDSSGEAGWVKFTILGAPRDGVLTDARSQATDMPLVDIARRQANQVRRRERLLGNSLQAALGGEKNQAEGCARTTPVSQRLPSPALLFAHLV
jgi:hypothetical protein